MPVEDRDPWANLHWSEKSMQKSKGPCGCTSWCSQMSYPHIHAPHRNKQDTPAFWAYAGPVCWQHHRKPHRLSTSSSDWELMVQLGKCDMIHTLPFGGKIMLLIEKYKNLIWKRPSISSPAANLTLPLVSKCHICTSFTYLQGWWPNHIPGLPVPILEKPFDVENFP